MCMTTECKNCQKASKSVSATREIIPKKSHFESLFTNSSNWYTLSSERPQPKFLPDLSTFIKTADTPTSCSIHHEIRAWRSTTCIAPPWRFPRRFPRYRSASTRLRVRNTRITHGTPPSRSSRFSASRRRTIRSLGPTYRIDGNDSTRTVSSLDRRNHSRLPAHHKQTSGVESNDFERR